MARNSPVVVDTCILVDIAVADVRHAAASAQALNNLSRRGLLVAPVTFVELAPVFSGDLSALENFLEDGGFDFRTEYQPSTWQTAAEVWSTYVGRRVKQRNAIPKRPIADILIGAFASEHGALITRNAKDFEAWFPKLDIIVPASFAD